MMKFQNLKSIKRWNIVRNAFLAAVVISFLIGVRGEAQVPLEGFYISGHAGWGFHEKVWIDRDMWASNFGRQMLEGRFPTVNDGFIGGGGIGYNSILYAALLGVEVDFSGANLRSDKSYSPFRTTILTLSDRCSWFGTIRARGGIIFDNLLVYGTAGAAYAHFNHRWEIEFRSSSPSGQSFSSKNTHWGFATGAGLEWAFLRAFSLKAEALFLKFPDFKKTVFSSHAGERLGQTVTFDLQNSLWVARVGINFYLRQLLFR